MIAPDWEFNGLVQSPSGYDSSRSFSSLETNDVKDMDLEFMRFKEDEEEESDGINVHGHAKLDLGLSRSDSNVCEEAGSTFKADHGFRRILMTSLRRTQMLMMIKLEKRLELLNKKMLQLLVQTKEKELQFRPRMVLGFAPTARGPQHRYGGVAHKALSATSKPTYTYPAERKASETTEPGNILCSKSFEARASCLSSSLTALSIRCPVRS